MLKIRLSRYGKKHAPFYRIVVVDVRKKRDGSYIEKVGIYNPANKKLIINKDIALKWLNIGAKPSLIVKHLLSKEGVIKDFTDSKLKKLLDKNKKKIKAKTNEKPKKLGKKKKAILEKKARIKIMHKKTAKFLEKKSMMDAMIKHEKEVESKQPLQENPKETVSNTNDVKSQPNVIEKPIIDVEKNNQNNASNKTSEKDNQNKNDNTNLDQSENKQQNNTDSKSSDKKPT